MNEPSATPSGPPGIPLARARQVAGRVLGRLAREEACIRLATAGDMRRMAPRVEGVVLLATAHAAGALLDAFLGQPWITGARHPDADVALGESDGVAVALRVLPDDDETAFAAQQLWLTARRDHFAALAAQADARGLALDPRGLWRGAERLPTPTEAALYETLELPFFPPELREGGTLEPPPEDLVAMGDICGVGGIHTDAGAGRYGLAPMAERVRREGYAWMVVAEADVDPAEVLAIERLALEEEQQQPFRILTLADLPAVFEVSGSPDDEPPEPAAHAGARSDGVRALVSAGARDLVGVDDAICAVGQLRRQRWTRSEVLSTYTADEVTG